MIGGQIPAPAQMTTSKRPTLAVHAAVSAARGSDHGWRDKTTKRRTPGAAPTPPPRTTPGRQALSGLSFRIESEETVAGRGRGGGGKSSLVRLLLRLYDPPAGACWWSYATVPPIRFDPVAAGSLD
jgi:ABC-type multidrug transport system fused ATPase/permease subunit